MYVGNIYGTKVILTLVKNISVSLTLSNVCQQKEDARAKPVYGLVFLALRVISITKTLFQTGPIYSFK